MARRRRAGSGWRWQLVRGRLRDQAPVVAMVTVVAVAATTLVGLLAGLLHLARTDAVPAALGRLDTQDVRLDATLWVQREDAGAVVDTAREALAEITGDVPTDLETWSIGSWLRVPRPDDEPSHLAYLAALPRSDDLVRLLDGRWPQPTSGDDGVVEVSVPQVAAAANGWVPGSRVEVSTWAEGQPVVWSVVGTYEAAGPAEDWFPDRLRGAGTDPFQNVPGSGGRLTTTAWGPMVVDPSVLDGSGTVDTAYLLATPRLGEASRAAVAELRRTVRDGPAILSERLRPLADGRLRTSVGATVDATWREVVVTSAGVTTTGLLLATLATTVMLLGARLLAERRAAQNELLAARGASPGQLRSAVVLEALGLAAVTWLVSPWLAQGALGLLVRAPELAEAGYRVGPGAPAPVLLACAAMAGVLAVALCVPAWHTAGSSAGTTHARLLRAGGDVALLALGTLGVARLVAYGSPLVAGDDGPRVDVVLVAGPALVTLAAGTLALRLVAPAGRAADVAAARARSFVVPFAGWQVARRPAHASGTVLLVVVAVVAGTFAASLGATWRTSQIEQADLALGTDMRVVVLPDDPLAASAVTATATSGRPDVHAQPVVDRTVGVGLPGNPGVQSAQLLAVDTTRPQDLRGRSGTTAAALLADLTTSAPAPGGTGQVPPGTQWLVTDVLLGTEPATEGGTGMVRLAVADEHGVVLHLEARTVPLGARTEVAVELPRTDGLRVVAVSGSVAPRGLPPADPDDPLNGSVRHLGIGLTVHAVRAVPRTAGLHTPASAATAPGAPVTLASDGWSATARQARQVRDADVTGLTDAHGTAALELTGSMTGDGWQMEPGRLVAHGWTTDPLRAVVSTDLAQALDVQEGDALALSVTGTRVDVRVARVVDHVPGAPLRPAVLVDRSSLARALLDADGQPGLTDAFWLSGPDDALAAVAADLHGTGATVTSRAEEHDDAVSGPVRVALPAALSLVAAAAGLLVLVGVGTVAAGALASRRLELARLQALGASRPGLVGGLVLETALLVVLAGAVGLLAGYGLAAVVAPLLTMSPDGRAPVPAPWLVWGWGRQTLQTAALAVGACAVVTAVVALGVRRTSGAALRMGDER